MDAVFGDIDPPANSEPSFNQLISRYLHAFAAADRPLLIP
jgi:hypothetical protein